METCPTDDDPQLYALERLPEPAAAVINEHLLVCEKCRQRLAGWDDCIAAMRKACRLTIGGRAAGR
jgi:anti-sigma factor RsiW